MEIIILVTLLNIKEILDRSIVPGTHNLIYAFFVSIKPG